MIDFQGILKPLYYHRYGRSLGRALIPARYRRTFRRWMGPAEVQWCRVVMNRETEQFIRSLECPSLDVLEISGTGSQGRYDFKSYQSTTFPDYDVCAKPLARNNFDLVIAEQVFEHVLRPDLAAANVYEMLRPGGVFVVTTPFLLKLHGPVDISRWTEHGMRQLLENAGFMVVGTGSWGNRVCLAADLTDGQTWTPYRPGRHSLHNEPQFPIVVWAFASRPEVGVERRD